MGSTQSALAAYERRRTEQRMGAMPPQTPSQAPAMHPMVGPVPNGQAPARPGMDRASTFPTPPTSASSVALNPQGSPYEYSMPSQSQQLSIDTTISNQRSVPNTPASTPPGKATHGSAVYSNSQSYDPARPVYSNATPSGQYQRQVQFGGPLQPPPSYKSEYSPHHRNQDNNPLTFISEEEEHDHQEYHSSNGYVPSQSAYSYNPNSASAGQPSPQQNGSGRVTPRTSTSQIYQYPTPQRSNTAPASNVYNVMEPRDAANGHESHYYPAPTNGAGTKRGREDDDEVEDSKRQKVDPEDGGPVGGSPYPSINAGRPVIAARKAR
jgi:protein SOK2